MSETDYLKQSCLKKKKKKRIPTFKEMIINSKVSILNEK